MITREEIKQYATPAFDGALETARQNGVITWYPWVGKNYPSAAVKVLVVLESHYQTKENTDAIASPIYTRRIMAERLFPQYWWPSRTGDGLNRCLGGPQITKQNAHLLWGNAASYNFIQRPMSSPRERPNKKDFAAGWNSFLSVAGILKPDVCIFVGFAAISRIKLLPSGIQVSGPVVREKVKINGVYPPEPFQLILQDQRIMCAVTKHPGRCFSPAAWGEVLARQIPAAVSQLHVEL